jgi:hypothetical protein
MVGRCAATARSLSAAPGVRDALTRIIAAAASVIKRAVRMNFLMGRSYTLVVPIVYASARRYAPYSEGASRGQVGVGQEQCPVG